MEVRLRPETELRLHQLAAQSGRSADELVEDALRAARDAK
jgi:predicted transcriptional regulator